MNKQEYEELRTKLIAHHYKSIQNDCTASPIFKVRFERVVWGFEEEFAQEHALFHCDTEYDGYESVQEFVDDYEEDEWVHIFANTDYFTKESFLEYHTDLETVCDTMQQLQPDFGWQVLHGNKEWRTFRTFLTYDEAYNCCVAKGGDPTRNIHIDSMYYSNAFTELVDLIAKGKLVYE